MSSESGSQLLITPTPPEEDDAQVQSMSQPMETDLITERTIYVREIEAEDDSSFPTRTFQITRRKKNQYSEEETDEEIFAWLKDNCYLSESLNDKFICWNTPSHSDDIKGFAFNKRNGEYEVRARINRNGKKIFAYVFVYEMHYPENPSQEEDGSDIHHLCCNPRCFRPTHLIKISIQENRSKERDMCPGWICVQLDDGSYVYFKVCTHDPECKKIHLVSNSLENPFLSDINENQ
jgi:hypothetical protein